MEENKGNAKIKVNVKKDSDMAKVIEVMKDEKEKFKNIAQSGKHDVNTETWEELREEYSTENYPPFGGPFTDAQDPWEWLSNNFHPPKRL